MAIAWMRETRASSRSAFGSHRAYAGGRRGFLLLAAAAVTAGIAFNWSWLAAAGVAPLLLSVLPCLAMCGLGLCMNKMTGGSCQSDKPVGQIATSETEDETQEKNHA
jgi:hypothetical protein